MVLRRDVALGRAHVDARLVHAPVAELHLEGLMNDNNNKSHGGGGDKRGDIKNCDESFHTSGR